jgi:hypothetical protein
LPFAALPNRCSGKTLAGRPIKLEGNPQHPMSGGACDAFTQAAILQLYDPDRSQAPRFKGREASWDRSARGAAPGKVQTLDSNHGKGLHIVCGASSSPTLGRQLEDLRRRWPEARLYHAEPFAETQALRVSEQVFGQPLQARHHLENAEVLVCLEDDPLGSGPRQTPLQRGWAERRRLAAQGQGAALSFVAESIPTLTGAAATRRLAIAPSRLPDLTLALEPGLGDNTRRSAAPEYARQLNWVDAAATALKAHPGRGLICVGPQAAADVQAQVMRLNQRLGAHRADAGLAGMPTLLGYERGQFWGSLEQLSPAVGRGQCQPVIAARLQSAYKHRHRNWALKACCTKCRLPARRALLRRKRRALSLACAAQPCT